MPGQEPDKPAGRDFEKSLKEMEKESAALKAEIERERRLLDMPVDSNLGSPDWDEKAKDGRFDAPKDEEE
jgi:hypothetical protein